MNQITIMGKQNGIGTTIIAGDVVLSSPPLGFGWNHTSKLFLANVKTDKPRNYASHLFVNGIQPTDPQKEEDSPDGEEAIEEFIAPHPNKPIKTFQEEMEKEEKGTEKQDSREENDGD